MVEKIKFTLNFDELDILGYTCPSFCINKFAISVDGKISKCDTISDELCIGKLDFKGNMLLDKHEEWVPNIFNKNEKCDKCFYSCACIKGSCPKTKVLYGETKCALNKSVLDGLLKLFYTTYEIIKI